MSLLVRFLEKLIRVGRLKVVDSQGRVFIFGEAPLPGISSVTIRLHKARLSWTIPFRSSLVVGEAYMNGDLTIEEGTLFDFLAIASENIHRYNARFAPGERWMTWLRRFQQWNGVTHSKHNVAHHYNLSGKLYDLFLDPDKQYSCGYFTRPDMTLAEAQIAKKRHLMAKLCLNPGQRVLDIGCGWGGLALSMAREADVEVTGITLSEEQLKVAQQRAAAAGLQDRVHFQLIDYREIPGHFDRIVSVGMFEHVGVGFYQTYFHRLRELLNDQGIALIHSIGRMHGGGATNSWIRRYIFPGGYIPALSEVIPHIENSGLYTTDIEILRIHYADTLREWRHQFMRHWNEVIGIYDERFCRMWELYLAGSECAFRYLGFMVFQLQLSRDLLSVPLTRDYISETERNYAHQMSDTIRLVS